MNPPLLGLFSRGQPLRRGILLNRPAREDLHNDGVTLTEADRSGAKADLKQEITARWLANCSYSMYDPHKKNLWFADNRQQPF